MKDVTYVLDYVNDNLQGVERHTGEAGPGGMWTFCYIYDLFNCIYFWFNLL